MLTALCAILLAVSDVKIVKNDHSIEAVDPGIKLFVRKKQAEGQLSAGLQSSLCKARAHPLRKLVETARRCYFFFRDGRGRVRSRRGGVVGLSVARALAAQGRRFGARLTRLHGLKHLRNPEMDCSSYAGRIGRFHRRGVEQFAPPLRFGRRSVRSESASAPNAPAEAPTLD
jgi:hypothetical protein